MTTTRNTSETAAEMATLWQGVQAQARALGFSQIGVAGVDLAQAEPGLRDWLARGFHGDMAYMQAHGMKRARPAELVPGTASVISVRMDYLPQALPEGWQAVEFARLQRPEEGIVSLYARGRDYHKVLRNRLQRLADWMQERVGPFGHRVFTDSAPVLEVELATQADLGWRGKHSLLLHRDAGSMFFLGEIFVDFSISKMLKDGEQRLRAASDSIAIGEPDPRAEEPAPGSCGSCQACIDVCPTQAILAPGLLDARRCISYLTIEHHGSIPEALRPLMGNRIYGCDDCQLVCPWNKFAQRATLPDFDARAPLTGRSLVELFAWSDADFLRHTEGSAIRRIGHERWLRNVAVALGNALRAASPADAAALRAALQARAADASALVREHVAWALAQAAATPAAGVLKDAANGPAPTPRAG